MSEAKAERNITLDFLRDRLLEHIDALDKLRSQANDFEDITLWPRPKSSPTPEGPLQAKEKPALLEELHELMGYSTEKLGEAQETLNRTYRRMKALETKSVG